ncbi:MAG: M24 family metallopeptidase, partial [Alphaproteobacteria bacterium]
MSYTDALEAPERNTGRIKIHDAEAFEGMRRVGRLAAEAHDMLVEEIKPGITTDHIDRLVFDYGMDHGAYPAPLNYRGFRKACCTSINHVVCHGIPGDRVLRDGDAVNVDVTYILDGWHG